MLVDEVLPGPLHGEVLPVQEELTIDYRDLAVSLVVREDEATAFVVNLKTLNFSRTV